MDSTQTSGGVAQGMLLAFMNPPASDEDGFNAWYNDEHAPNRLTVPGICNARRYRADTDEGPRYAATYDLETVDVLQRPDYLRLNTDRSERETAMMAKIPLIDRRVLQVVLNAPAWTDNPPYLLTVSVNPAEGGDDDLVAWYRDEHIPMLLQVPGWKRVRLYASADGQGTRFVAVHELESLAVFETEAYRAAVSTPWRERVMGQARRRDAWRFRFFQDFPRPAWGRV